MHAEVPFEPLTALAGGIIGGAIVAAIAWASLARAAHRNRRGARA